MGPVHPVLASELPAAQDVPDLELLVQERHGSGGWTFDLRLKARDPDLDLNYLGTGSITLRVEPGEFFRRQIGEIWKGRPRTAEEWAGFANLLRVKGAYLSETILPAELRRRLAELRGRVRSLLIQSDDPWIPWEILCVPETPGGEAADGPFLCEAFALTRWLGGTGQTRWLPLQRLAVVVPRDSGLPQAEGEYEDLLALARDGARRIERIPARVGDLHAALCKGEHDGWHFSGHGLHRESAPDLSGLWLEDGGELTPDYLSGAARNLGSRRPLVFLNACSSGKTGASLTGIGGWPPHFLRAGAGSCIGTLWPIDDEPARAFSKAFYGAFLAGAPMAEAVFAARQAIRSDGNPTWLAYTVFAHPLAVCAPPPARGEMQDRQAISIVLPPPAPAAGPLQERRAQAAAGLVLLLLVLATSGYLIRNRMQEPDGASAADEPVSAPSQVEEPAQSPPPAATPSVDVSPENRPVQGASHDIDAGAGFPKAIFEQALKSAMQRGGISGWVLDLAAEAPRITTVDQDGVSQESCRLTAHGRARGQGRSLDLGPVHAVNSQFDSTLACEEAAKKLAEEAIHQLVSTLRRETP